LEEQGNYKRALRNYMGVGRSNQAEEGKTKKPFYPVEKMKRQDNTPPK
jgi:hypothetical protein